MKAVILVGGYGTRLRPFTFECPKPLVPFCNMPIVVHQIEALVKVGVKKIILAVNVQPEKMMDFLSECEKKYNISIVCSLEKEPMGTAGPLALCKDHLLADDAPFFMLNSDVICEFPFDELYKFHKAHGKEGTILVTEVKEPSKYGVVVAEEEGKIERFVEKPQVFVSNKINAGIYLFETSMLRRIPNRPTSIEREIFPTMAVEGELYRMILPGYWMDIGQPKDYLTGTVLHLASLHKNDPKQLASGAGFTGNVLIHPTAKIGQGCLLGPDVVVGPNVVIEDGVRMKKTSLFSGVQVKKGAFLENSIVGFGCKIGSWAHISDSFLGDDVFIKEELVLNDCVVCPHKEIKENQHQHKIIL